MAVIIQEYNQIMKIEDPTPRTINLVVICFIAIPIGILGRYLSFVELMAAAISLGIIGRFISIYFISNHESNKLLIKSLSHKCKNDNNAEAKD